MIGRKALFVVGLALTLFLSSHATAIEIRQIDGTGNNLVNTINASANSELLRLLPAAYDDGVSEPRGGASGTSLPSARAISNALAAQSVVMPSARGVSSWLWQWGQFIDHDLDLTGSNSAEPFNIVVPMGDPSFDPAAEGNKLIHLDRSIFNTAGSGPRQQINQITAFIDGSNVYGSDALRAADLRAFDGSGKLRTSNAANGEVLLPFNTSGLENAMPGPGTAADFFIAGDIRANEQIGLTATHTLFMREHNRLADEIKSRLDSGIDPLLSSMRDSAILAIGNGINNQGDFIYEAARKVVGAQIQKITYDEFIPVLLGDNALPTYSGYDESVNPGITNAFSTAAFRVGHTMLPAALLRSHDLDISSANSIALRDAFFNPQEIINNGIDTLLIGMLLQPAQEVDTRIVDDVRNFLFGHPGAGGFDLASLNIQRGRDHGLASYNDYRELYGLGRATDFTDITAGDLELAALFSSVYGGDIDAVDLWVGGLAEQHYNGGMVGETFWRILADQFARLRDGDRFAFLNAAEMEDLLMIDPMFEQHTHLNDIIERNTSYTGMPETMFMLQAQVPAPGTLVLLLLGMIGLLLRLYVFDSRF